MAKNNKNKNKKTQRDKKKKENAKKRKAKQAQVREQFRVAKLREKREDERQLAREDIFELNDSVDSLLFGSPADTQNWDPLALGEVKSDLNAYEQRFIIGSKFIPSSSSLDTVKFDMKRGLAGAIEYFENLCFVLSKIGVWLASHAITVTDVGDREWTIGLLKELAESPVIAEPVRSLVAAKLVEMEVSDFEKYITVEDPLSKINGAIPSYTGLAKFEQEFFHCRMQIDVLLMVLVDVERTENTELYELFIQIVQSSVLSARSRAYAAIRLRKWGHPEGQACVDELVDYHEIEAQVAVFDVELQMEGGSTDDDRKQFVSKYFDHENPLLQLKARQVCSWDYTFSETTTEAMVKAYSGCSEKQRTVYFRDSNDVPNSKTYRDFFKTVMKTEDSNEVLKASKSYWDILDLTP